MIARDAPEDASPTPFSRCETVSGDDVVLGVAVLPFENLSTEEDNAFFAGGVHEDVLSHISRINDLKVISRTTMLRIAGRNLDIPEIGRQLGVTHVLEGSVRRAGDQVRVTVQLIDAANDRHLWAENYDRQLDDIFSIQSEIASSIAAQLRTELSPQERALIEEAPTSNVMAYDLYLQARELNQVWRGSQGFEDQRELLEQALAIDPEFVDAQVMLAAAYGRLVWTGADPDGIYRVKARELTGEIQDKFPGSPQAAMARADFRYTVMHDYDQALRDYLAILAEDPNNADVLQVISSSLKRMRRHAEALPYLERAVAVDPENPRVHSERVVILQGMGKIDESIELLKANEVRFPEDETIRGDLARAYLFQRGDIEAWRALSPNRIGTANARDDAGAFVLGDAVERRLAVEEFGIDAVLAGLERSREEGDEWGDIMIGIAAAQALGLAGREAESVARARKALGQMEARTVQGKPFPGTTPQIMLTMNAYVACMADEPDKAAFLLGLADGLEVDDVSFDAIRRFARTLTQAECGAVDEAWETFQSIGSSYWVTTSWIKTDPIFAHYFGDLPAYQAMLEPGS